MVAWDPDSDRARKMMERAHEYERIKAENDNAIAAMTIYCLEESLTEALETIRRQRRTIKTLVDLCRKERKANGRN